MEAPGGINPNKRKAATPKPFKGEKDGGMRESGAGYEARWTNGRLSWLLVSPGWPSACHWNRARQRNKPAKRASYKPWKLKNGKNKNCPEKVRMDESALSSRRETTPCVGRSTVELEAETHRNGDSDVNETSGRPIDQERHDGLPG